MLDHTNDKIPLCLLTSRKTTLFIEDASIYVIEKYGWFLMVPGRGRLDYLDLARPRGLNRDAAENGKIEYFI